MSFNIDYSNAGIFNIIRPENDLILELWGACGGGEDSSSKSNPGYLKVYITGVANQTIEILVASSPSDYKGGFGGGAAAENYIGFGGGGSTSIKISSSVLAIAGGGGGSANTNSGVQLGGYGGGGGDGKPSSFGGKGAVGIIAGAGGTGRYPSEKGSSGMASSFTTIGLGGGGIYAAGGAGYAGGGGGGYYLSNIGSGGGGSNGIYSQGSYVVTELSSLANVTTRPSGGSSNFDGYARLVFLSTVAPTLNITAPSPNSNIYQGLQVNITGNASSVQSGDLTSNIIWSRSDNTSLGVGGSILVDTTSWPLGQNVVVAECTEPITLGVAYKNLVINIIQKPNPVVTINAPNNNEIISGISYQFQGSAIDAFDGDVSASIEWKSDIDGVFAMGANPIVTTLTPGVHLITATATTSGRTGSDQVSGVTVVVTSDNVIIVKPTWTVWNSNETIDWEGVATASNVYVSNQLEWYLQDSTQFGAGATFSTLASILPLGTSQITVLLPSTSTVAQKNLTRTDDPPPSISILQPPNQSNFVEGTSVNFQGIASDIPAQNLSANITWFSNNDGMIGSGASFNTSTLSINWHTITAKVETSRGQIETSIVLAIQPPIGPFISWSSPPDHSVYTLLDDVNFSGTSFSSGGQNLSAGLMWYSDIFGSIGQGSFVPKTAAQLGVGHHNITVVSFDPVTSLTNSMLRQIDIVSEVCLHEDSLIQMENGKWKPISSIKSGDIILDCRSQPVAILRNIQFTNRPRDYISLWNRKEHIETLILPAHPLLLDGVEMPAECLVQLGLATVKRKVTGHVYTLCTHQRTFVKAGMNCNIGTWSEDGLANFLQHDKFGKTLMIAKEQ